MFSGKRRSSSQSDTAVVLAQLAPGRHAIIVGMAPQASVAMVNRLRHLGFRPTSHVDVIRRAPLGDPTIYRGLEPFSPDEQVVADLLTGKFHDIERPDAIVQVADVTTLRRSMTLVAEVLRLDLPCMLVLTMSDELAARGGTSAAAPRR